MYEAEKRQWLDLCARAADERDPKQLAELAAEITLLLRLKMVLLNSTNDKQDEWYEAPSRSSLTH